MARSIMIKKGITIMFLEDVVSTAVYIQNRSQTKAVPNKTPFEVLTDRKPSIKHLKVFGCICYTHVLACLR